MIFKRIICLIKGHDFEESILFSVSDNDCEKFKFNMCKICNKIEDIDKEGDKLNE